MLNYKSQIPNYKQITMSNERNYKMFSIFGYCDFEFVYCL